MASRTSFNCICNLNCTAVSDQCVANLNPCIDKLGLLNYANRLQLEMLFRWVANHVLPSVHYSSQCHRPSLGSRHWALASQVHCSTWAASRFLQLTWKPGRTEIYRDIASWLDIFALTWRELCLNSEALPSATFIKCICLSTSRYALSPRKPILVLKELS